MNIIEQARAQGLPETETEGVFRVNADDLGRMLAAERERCAKVCEEIAEAYRGTRWGIYGEVIGGKCADEIRKGSS